MDYTILHGGARATRPGCSYWSGHGAYQRELEFFERDLVPDSKQADTLHGELLRCATHLYWDFFDNGNENARRRRFYHEREDCLDCLGHGKTVQFDTQKPCSVKIEIKKCKACGGKGRIETTREDVVISNEYNYYIQFIARAQPTAEGVLERIKKIIRLEAWFAGTNEYDYDSLLDFVLHAIITTENRELLQSDMPDGITLGRLYDECFAFFPNCLVATKTITSPPRKSRQPAQLCVCCTITQRTGPPTSGWKLTSQQK